MELYSYLHKLKTQGEKILYLYFYFRIRVISLFVNDVHFYCLLFTVTYETTTTFNILRKFTAFPPKVSVISL